MIIYIHGKCMKPPQISVIIPVFNHERELHRCLATLRDQTFKDFEVIVVDDGSETPVTLPDFVNDFEYPVMVVRQNNGGAPVARNRGFDESIGEYVIFSDADILWEKEALEKMYDVLVAKPNVDIVYSSFYFGWKKFMCGEFSREKLEEHNIFHTSSMMRREKFSRFDESLKRFQDWDLWLTMTEAGAQPFWISEYLFRVIPHEGGMSKFLPSFLYRFSFLPGVAAYRAAERVIREKHGI